MSENENKRNGRDDEGTSFADWAGLPRAKRSARLNRLTHALSGKHLRETFEVFGTKYTLETLRGSAETWATNHTSGSTGLQVGRNQMAPIVAASLRAIDGVPIEDDFLIPEETDKETRELLEKSKAAHQDWLRREVFLWLLDEEDSQPDLVRELWARYAILADKRREALEGLAPLSKGEQASTPETPVSGESRPTSSPEKES